MTKPCYPRRKGTGLWGGVGAADLLPKMECRRPVIWYSLASRREASECMDVVCANVRACAYVCVCVHVRMRAYIIVREAGIRGGGVGWGVGGGGGGGGGLWGGRGGEARSPRSQRRRHGGDLRVQTAREPSGAQPHCLCMSDPENGPKVCRL